MTLIMAFQNLQRDFGAQIITPEIASEIGLEENIVLNQIHYWITKCGQEREGHCWIYNTFEAWSEQFSFWHISKIKRVFASLEKQGLIMSKKFLKSQGNHTKSYTIAYEKLVKLVKKLSNSKLDAEKNLPDTRVNYRSVQNGTIYSDTTNHNNNNKYLSNKREESVENDDLVVLEETSLREKENLNVFEEKFKEMIAVWGEVFLYDKKNYSLTEKRKANLLTLFRDMFQEDMGKWKEFCIKINSSKFLMGEKKKDFKASFDWVIKQDIAERIMKGEFGVGDRTTDIQSREIQAISAQNKVASLKELQQKEQEERVGRLAEELFDAEVASFKRNWSDHDLGAIKEEIRTYFHSGIKLYESVDCNKSNFFAPLGINIEGTIDSYISEHYLKKPWKAYLDEARMRLGIGEQ